jgi:SAM-dependent methyltransferase
MVHWRATKLTLLIVTLLMPHGNRLAYSEAPADDHEVRRDYSLRKFLQSPPAAHEDEVHVGVGQTVSMKLFKRLPSVKNQKSVTGVKVNMWESMWNQHLQDQKRPPWGQDASTFLEPVLRPVWEDRTTTSVLEVGCGSGADSIYLHKAGFGRVVGLDISPTATLLAQENFANITADSQYKNPGGILRFHNAEFFKYAEELANSDGSLFDVVWDRGLFHNLGEHERHYFAVAVARVLAPGGHLFVMAGIQKSENEFDCPVHMPGVTKAALLEIGEDEALDVLNVTTVTRQH